MMIDNPINVVEGTSYPVDIYIAGNVEDAVRICRDYCLRVGLCVHVIRADFVYSGGCESGVKVGLINYPRFPADPVTLLDRAIDLARVLICGLSQGSATVQALDHTVWLTRRGEEIA